MNRQGVVNIEIFSALDKIREKHGITAEAWSRAADLKASRISELRNCATGNGGRSMSLKTLQSLIIGFQEILGVKMTKDEILQEIEALKKECKSEDVNLLIITLLNSKTNQEATPILEALLHKV